MQREKEEQEEGGKGIYFSVIVETYKSENFFFQLRLNIALLRKVLTLLTPRASNRPVTELYSTPFNQLQFREEKRSRELNDHFGRDHSVIGSNTLCMFLEIDMTK